MSTPNRRISLKSFLLLLMAFSLLGQTSSVSIMMGPISVKLSASNTQQFKAFVRGTGNTAIAWSISPSLGTISRTGFYTAPSSIPATVNVLLTATSMADPSKSSTATITLQSTAIATPVSVTAAPANVSLKAAQTQQFTATVTGAAQTGVSWSVDPPVGTISSTGMYTAPATVSSAQSVMVKATSIADSTKSAMAVIALAVTQAIVPVSVVFAAPTDGSQVSGQVPLNATTTGSVTAVRFYVDSASVGSPVTAPPYTTTWNSTAVPDGSHTISAMAVDAAGGQTTKTISVSVKNSASVGPLMLPLEVMGPSGFVLTTQVNVPSAPSGTQRLWLQVHGLKYQTEASVQVNNAAWMPINDSTVTLLGLASAYGGIGGGFATLKLTMTLPPNTVVAGVNTVRFRFNGTDGVVSGFRVLGLNFVGPDGVGMLSNAAFVQEDPSTWRGPSQLSSDINAGKALWYSAPLTTPGGAIQAKCTDCHAQDGRDLKYFNYSNNTIRVRAMFHGLTQQQGDQIASYIRSLNTPAPSNARPWNPPYQPGPGLDSGPVANWSAGAGLDAVLDRDVDMLNYLAPGGSTASWTATANMSAREIPIAFPLPDWNNWLPRIHPLDGWGNLFTSSRSFGRYNVLHSTLIAGSAQSYKDHYNDLEYFADSFLDDIVLPSNNPIWTARFTDQVYSFQLWMMVKHWELNQEFQLEGMGQAVHGPKADARAWAWGDAFATSPNMLHIPVGAPGIHNGTRQVWHYLAQAWYQYQLIFNYSNYGHLGRPIDWGYTMGIIKDLGQNDSAPQASLLMLWMIKALQASEFDYGPETGEWGWNPGVNNQVLFVYPEFNQLFKDYSPSQRAFVTEAYLQNWLAKIRTFTPQQLYAGGWASATEVPKVGLNSTLANALAYSLPQFRFFGVSSGLVTQIADWAKTVWPLGSWDMFNAGICHWTSGGTVICTSYP